MPKKQEFSPMNDRASRVLLYICIIGLLVFSLIDFSILASVWPYILMVIGMLIIIKFFKNNKKWLEISIIILMLFMFGFNFWFYYVLPYMGGYQPVTIPGQPTIFQLEGKYKISYYPDYPKPGSSVQLYAELCNIEENNCTKCSNCSLSGYFSNEEGRQQTLFQNISLENQSNVEFTFPGPLVNVFMRYNSEPVGNFFVPRPSFYQSIVIALDQNPILGTISFIAFIAGIIGSIIGIFIKRKEIYDRLTSFIEYKTKKVNTGAIIEGNNNRVNLTINNLPSKEANDIINPLKEEIIKNFDKLSIIDLIQKASIYANLKNDKKALEWLKNELYGYPENAKNVPKYRRIQAQIDVAIVFKVKDDTGLSNRTLDLREYPQTITLGNGIDSLWEAHKSGIGKFRVYGIVHPKLQKTIKMSKLPVNSNFDPTKHLI